MIIYVDVDDTICHRAQGDGLNYDNSKPYLDRIAKINELFDEGHVIVYWTARGTKTSINWFQTTLEQLNQWGCKFNELRMGKPVYDLFIDDKNINSDAFFSDLE